MSAPPRIYVSRRIPDRVIGALRESFDVAYHDSELSVARDVLLANAAGVSGCVLTLGDRADDEFFAAAGPQLKVVANYAVGFDNVDLEAASRRGITVANTPDVLTHDTAEFAIALALALLRRVAEGDRFLRGSPEWAWAPTMMLGTSLRGLVLGIVGFGRIGQEVARLGSCLGMRVVFSDSIERGGATFEQLKLSALLQCSDVVSLHCPLLPETRHLIGVERLRAMKSTACLVNTSRGAVVDEEALVAALRERRIAGAALDVYEHEPKVSAALLDLDNVVLAPHLASATTETREAMGELCVAALRAVLVDGSIPPNAVLPRHRSAQA